MQLIMRLFKKSKKKTLIDNYDKICHLLDLQYDLKGDTFIGKCSLCGTENFFINNRCRFCRAEIED